MNKIKKIRIAEDGFPLSEINECEFHEKCEKCTGFNMGDTKNRKQKNNMEIINNLGFDKEKEWKQKYCPQCYFEDDILILPSDCRHKNGIDKNSIKTKLEEFLQSKIKFIELTQCTFIGTPGDLLNEIFLIVREYGKIQFDTGALLSAEEVEKQTRLQTLNEVIENCCEDCRKSIKNIWKKKE